ncbi:MULTISPECIES: alanine/glycine:cation symporter family protein [Vitreoscilla]|uniref:Alanine:cation symporter family protein n=1 Tax=Vitreoscilla stercoraria TaxID=61 RepID=A0ABY4EAN8_VITST|nr:MULTISPECIES: alanine/glycine:cation symporter family protein [Vitreoscilla]QJQ52430.1 amino-acid carrier protein [Vitreoscilla sp. C1]UOO92522.1 alanine:cation symporter family protein [Vitreoscilla stercoraria]
MNEQLNDTLMAIVDKLNGPLWDFLVIFLVAIGLFYTIITGAVQLRLFLHSIKIMKNSRKIGNDDHGITPFQAFVTGLASRVGVGNVAGVAIAIALGGPGAVFWMWATAFLGMSSAFVESSLAQLFKIRDPRSKQFRGGPAYYITQGLKQKWLGVVFAIALILTYGFVFNAVQSNSIVSATDHAWGWNQANPMLFGTEISLVGIALVILTAAIIFGGIKRIATVAESFVPVMALLYLAVAMYIAAINLPILPDMFAMIFREAFQFEAAAGGFFGSMVSAAMMAGIKRGLFSNEAGMGSAPNAAAASDVKHPVNQGLVQMLGVFVDTFIVCTCTAVIILSSNFYTDASYSGVQLTQVALEAQIGSWGDDFLAIILFMFCYSSVIGNYAYAEGNMQFINNNPTVMNVFRVLVCVMVYMGAVTSIPLVWNAADLFMGVMATINLFAILLLTPYLMMLLKDYTSQLKRGVEEPEFKLKNHPKYKNKIKSDIW